MRPSFYNLISGSARRRIVLLVAGAALAGGVAVVLGLSGPNSATDEDLVRMEALSTFEIPAAGPATAETKESLLVEASPVAFEKPAAEWLDRELSGRQALLGNLELMEVGAHFLSRIPDYTATFFKQERIDDTLDEPQVTRVKLRHEPFSVYMKWQVGDKGREALYVEGENEGEMLVRVGGWKGRLMPLLRINPRGSLAMQNSRYAVTELGLARLTGKLLADRREDLVRNCGYRARLTPAPKHNGRHCYYFELEYLERSISPIYRKTEQLIDREWSIPLSIKNYTWPECNPAADADCHDESTLIEHYAYSDLDLQADLTDLDFAWTNTAYGFKR